MRKVINDFKLGLLTLALAVLLGSSVTVTSSAAPFVCFGDGAGCFIDDGRGNMKELQKWVPVT